MREWLFQTLVNDAALLAEIPAGRMAQASGREKVPTGKPYLLYRMGASRPLLHSEEVPAVSTPFQVFVYDDPGDYVGIETCLTFVRLVLTLNPPARSEPKFIRCRWLEDSPDLPEDPLTGTIAKFSRFQLIHKP